MHFCALRSAYAAMSHTAWLVVDWALVAAFVVGFLLLLIWVAKAHR